MSHLTLSNEESMVLASLIQSSITDLRSEIFHTDNWEFKRELKQRKQILMDMLARVNQLVPASGS